MKKRSFEDKSLFNCDSHPLHILLTGDEADDLFKELASHVDSCSDCQQRLERLAADPAHWYQVGYLLRDTEPDFDNESQTQSNLNGNDRSEVNGSTLAHLRGILCEPKHPEMLGRLGRYDVESIIGNGGMGIVLRAFDTELHRPVAIKILASHLAHSGPAKQRFAHESRAAAAVVHEHVVAIHDVQTDGGTPYLVMQYVAGESLQARVERQGPLPAKEILRIGMQAAAGLEAAHAQGVIHRDIKPANILLEPRIERALLTDFGLARTADDASLTQTGVVAGSPHYMSPEQALGKTTDASTDIYSLGVVLYFMATGHPPFRAERAMGVLNRVCHEVHRPVWESQPEIPDSISDIIDRCLQKKKSKRFPTAAELKEDLGRALAGLQQRTRRPPSPWLRRLRRKKTHYGFAIACLTVFVLASVAALFLNPLQNPHRGALDSQASKTAPANQLESSLPKEFQRTHGNEILIHASADEPVIWNQQIEEMERLLLRQSQSIEFSKGVKDIRWESGIQETLNKLREFEEGFTK